MGEVTNGDATGLVLIGGGSHAACLLDLCRVLGRDAAVRGYVDRAATGLPLPYLGDDAALLASARAGAPRLLMGIGVDIAVRTHAFRAYTAAGFSFERLVHPSAVISPTAELGAGCVVLPQAVVGAGAKLDDNVTLHSAAVVEHESRVGAHSYLAPGAVLAGRCQLGEACMLGVRAATVHDVTLGARCMLGAGAVLLGSFPEEGRTLVGTPARPLPATG